MINRELKYTILCLADKYSIEPIEYKQIVPAALREQVRLKTLAIQQTSESVELEELKNLIKILLGQRFVSERDKIRWIGQYGYDTASEDITNFLAAYIALENDTKKWQESGYDGDKPTTLHKVYLDKTTLAKGVVQLNLDQMTTVYNSVRASQFEAYAVYEQQTGELGIITTYEMLKEFITKYDILLEELLEI